MPIAAQTRDFREAVCQKFGCTPEAYADTVFSQCLYPHAIWPARLIRRLSPHYFDSDFELIHLLATSTEPQQIRAEMEDHRYHHPPVGLLRRRLRIRLSGQRVLMVAGRAFGRPPADAPPPSRVLDG